MLLVATGGRLSLLLPWLALRRPRLVEFVRVRARRRLWRLRAQRLLRLLLTSLLTPLPTHIASTLPATLDKARYPPDEVCDTR